MIFSFIWVLLSLIAFSISLWTIQDAEKDRKALKKRKVQKQSLQVLADHNFRAAIEHSWVQFVFVLVGIRALFNTESGLRDNDPWTVAVVLLFISAEVSLAVFSVMSALVRRKVLSLEFTEK